MKTPLKFGEKNNGWPQRRDRDDFALTLMNPGKDRAECWKVNFLLADAAGTVDRYTFSFPAVPVEDARKVRDSLRNLVEQGHIRDLGDWRAACLATRARMLELGWVVGVKGGLAVRPAGKGIANSQ